MTQHYPSEQFDANNCPFGETLGSLLKRLIDTQTVERGGYVVSYNEGNSRDNEGTGKIWCIKDAAGEMVSEHFTTEHAIKALIDLTGPTHEN